MTYGLTTDAEGPNVVRYLLVLTRISAKDGRHLVQEENTILGEESDRKG